MGSRADSRHRRHAVERAATRSCGEVPERTGLQPAGVITLEDPPWTTPVAAVLRGHRAPARGRAATVPIRPSVTSRIAAGIEPRCRRRRGCPRESGRNDCSPSLDRRSRSCPRVPPRIEAEQPGSFARRSGGLDVRRPFHRRERIRGAKTGPRGGHGKPPRDNRVPPTIPPPLRSLGPHVDQTAAP